MKKIAEWKKEDFSKGLSAQSFMPVGGLFQSMEGIDPFYNQGLAVPSFTAQTITPSSAPKFITNFNTGGTEYVYWHSDTEIKQILKDSPYTQTDRTSEITFTGSLPVIGTIVWKGKYIYARAGGDLRANSIPLTSANDVQLKTGFNSTFDSMALCVGGDGNLYHADNSRVGIITSATGTSGNSNIFTIDDNFNVRDLINDGEYLVIIADNNAEKTLDRKVGKYRCRVYFWDMIKATADIIYDIDDSYLIAGRQLDGNIYFFGYNGLYVCNRAVPPKMVRPFEGYNGVSRAKPTNPYQLVQTKGSIYWVDGLNNLLTNGNVFAYGNPTSGANKIFYNPHINSNSTHRQNVIQVVGEQFWVATAEPVIYVQNTGSTRGTGNIATLDSIFDTTYKFEGVKVVLANPLTSGQSVKCRVIGANGSKVVSAEETKSYSATNPRQNLIFKLKTQAGSIDKFENLRIEIDNTSASIQRIALYATPIDDFNEII
jgi:hypothetical protein